MDPPKSPTLLPPRKSVELEDPGAHDLESSNDEDEVFTDAPDQLAPAPLSPIPHTRVEKLDDAPSHGEVPGTTAYKMRTKDAVPDEIAIIPGGSRPSSRNSNPSLSPGGTPIPRTVVEKVDPSSPSHGEIPGTTAHALRRADAVPDAIITPSNSGKPFEESLDDEPLKSPVPKTVVTRVDSLPSYGEVPGTEAYEKRTLDAQPDAVEKKADVPSKHDPIAGSSSDRLTRPDLPTSTVNRSSTYFDQLGRGRSASGASPIAPDGGFGPMDYEDDGSSNEEDEDNENSTMPQRRSEEHDTESRGYIERTDDTDDSTQDDEDEGFGDDFDDFEEGEQADDFDQFDDGFQQPEERSEFVSARRPTVSSIAPPFAVLDFSTLDSLESIIEATSPHLQSLFPAVANLADEAPLSLPDQHNTFLTDRSLSLWSQLVAPPPLQPPNWVRSRIRRLFLVSLGVPVDLDEILPKSKQKKLILPYTSEAQGKEGRKGSVAQLKADANDSTPPTPTTANPNKSSSRRRKGPPPPPEFDVISTKQLCATTDAALDGMTDAELKNHVKKLEELVKRGEEVLQYWVRRKETAFGEKEAFDGVIENLVRHARKVRK